MSGAKARFQVDTRLARLLGEGYRSSELALRELVDNAWDADAPNVWVTLPEPLSGDPVIVRDDGVGMTAAALRNEYLKIAGDRRVRAGTLTPRRKRKVKGRKGIGKFAGLLLAREMRIDTVADGVRSSVVIDKRILLETERDLETVDLPLEETSAEPGEIGTTVTLSSLEPRFNFPVADKLREILVREYARQEDFSVTVNGKVLTTEDIPGTSSRTMGELPSTGAVDLRFTVSDGKGKHGRPGIVVRVDGKSVGEPSMFGLDEDEEIPVKLARRVFGEIEINGNDDFVAADWGGLIESSKAYAEIAEFVRRVVKAALKDAYAIEMNLQEARLSKRIKERIAHLPEFRRKYAHEAIQRILRRFYEEGTDRIEAIVDVALDALEHDAYWDVLQRINAASEGEVGEFADSLAEFGILELSAIGRQASVRLRFLDGLEELALRKETLEADVHKAIETNLWVLGRGFSTMSSNRTLRDIVRRFGSGLPEASRETKRPDLLLSQALDGTRTLIEFKRPSHFIDRADVAQAEAYRDDLSRLLPSGGIRILMLGKGLFATLDATKVAPDVQIQSYLGLISAARDELEWIIRDVRD
ncbi:ATP-binding protein [Aureimonas sp. ME7]|uniref:ATP-binding protein n=1 Tax=Aureimonas sp. ME7 TaxID=2744252 RepID=UPI0015F48495|nr:ATP-binding protein [Aureimonas sp. ME7]